MTLSPYLKLAAYGIGLISAFIFLWRLTARAQKYRAVIRGALTAFLLTPGFVPTHSVLVVLPWHLILFGRPKDALTLTNLAALIIVGAGAASVDLYRTGYFEKKDERQDT